MKILIVDDTAVIRDLLVTLLTTAGYDVVSSESGEGALELCRNEMFPLIISDIRMGGMSGIDFCSKLREFNPISYVIALTSYQKLFHVTECRSAGFDDYLNKPFEKEELLKRVEMGAYKVNEWMRINPSKEN
ncbi:MAG: response regulator [Lentisphaeraceae bacterium]|nr:response regulator [Lentisphaeraceae bacterium]